MGGIYDNEHECSLRKLYMCYHLILMKTICILTLQGEKLRFFSLIKFTEIESILELNSDLLR